MDQIGPENKSGIRIRLTKLSDNLLSTPPHHYITKLYDIQSSLNKISFALYK